MDTRKRPPELNVVRWSNNSEAAGRIDEDMHCREADDSCVDQAGLRLCYYNLEARDQQKTSGVLHLQNSEDTPVQQTSILRIPGYGWTSVLEDLPFLGDYNAVDILRPSWKAHVAFVYAC
jgi:hypothetical protein